MKFSCMPIRRNYIETETMGYFAELYSPQVRPKRLNGQAPSGLNQLKCGVDPLELDASGICCKAPIRLGLTAIASAQPSLDLPFQSLPVFDASVEALGDQNRQFGFGHVQPASMFGRVVPFETLNQAACLSGRKRFIE